jgi:hypothetical protein
LVVIQKKIPRKLRGIGKNRLEPMKNKIFANPFSRERKNGSCLSYDGGEKRVGEKSRLLTDMLKTR